MAADLEFGCLILSRFDLSGVRPKGHRYPAGTGQRLGGARFGYWNQGLTRRIRLLSRVIRF
jgi:hypothetical protein